MTFDIHADLLADGAYPEDEIHVYVEELCDGFVDSPEFRTLEDREVESWEVAGMFCDFLASYEGCLPPEADPSQVKHVVFSIFPRKVQIPPEAAEAILLELRLFWQFLEREFGLENAEECREALGEEHVERLARELDDPSNFGMAKSFCMAGRARGFDVSSEEGLAAWALRHNAGRLAASERPAEPAPSPAPPETSPQPLERAHPKPGRNEPCPCGSGRKYKKCCAEVARREA